MSVSYLMLLYSYSTSVCPIVAVRRTSLGASRSIECTSGWGRRQHRRCDLGLLLTSWEWNQRRTSDVRPINKFHACVWFTWNISPFLTAGILDVFQHFSIGKPSLERIYTFIHGDWSCSINRSHKAILVLLICPCSNDGQLAYHCDESYL